MKQMLEFVVIPLGRNRAIANEAIWQFLSSRGEGTVDRELANLTFGKRKHSGIRVTRDQVEMIRESARSFGFLFMILSCNPATGEVKEHFSAPKRALPPLVSGVSLMELGGGVLKFSPPEGSGNVLCPNCGKRAFVDPGCTAGIEVIRSVQGFSAQSPYGEPIGLVIRCACGADGIAPVMRRISG